MNIDLKKTSFQIFITSFCLILWATLSVSIAGAAPIKNVTLAAFDTQTAANGVVLTWTTATELDTMGFRIERESESDRVIFPDETSFIPALGSPTLGANYEFVDETAVSPHTYTYTLVEHMLNGSTAEISSMTVTVSDPTAAIQLIAPPTDAPRSTRTPQPTATAVPPTQLPTSTQTPQPTATELPTETAVSPTATPTATTQLLESNTEPQQVALVNKNIQSDTLQLESAPPAAPPIQTTPSDDYPAPPTPLPPETVTAYTEPAPESVQESVPPTPLPPTAYPANTNNGNTPSTQATVAVIGDSTEATRETESAAGNPENASSGRIYLWGGFLMGILIFSTAVIGAIILFARRNS